MSRRDRVDGGVRSAAVGFGVLVLTVVGCYLPWSCVGPAIPPGTSRSPPAVEARPVPPSIAVRPTPGTGGHAVEGLSIAIQSPTNRSDVGVAIDLLANVSGGQPPYQVAWNDSAGAWSFGRQWTLNSTVAGPVRVVAVATDAIGEMATSTLGLWFDLPPNVSITIPGGFVEPDRPFAIEFGLEGGVPPFSVNWTVASGGSNGSAIVPTAGVAAVTGVALAPGPVVVGATVRDAVGTRLVSTADAAVCLPPPAIVASSVVAELGTEFHLRLAVTGGVPPIRWTIGELPPAVEGAAASGLVGSDGSFDWATTFVAPGEVRVNVSLLDAVGGNTSAAIPVVIGPALQLLGAVASAVPGSASVADVIVDLQGGLPPYTWTAEANGSVAASGTIDGAGNTTVQVPRLDGLRLTITDGAGAVVATALEWPPGSGGSPPGSTAPPSALGEAAAPVALLLVAAVVAAIVVPRWRRRRSSLTEDPAELRGVVERLLGQSDGLDHESLTFRAEEEGLDRRQVVEAVAELRQLGRLSSRTGIDGEELLGLVSAAPRPEPPGGP